MPIPESKLRNPEMMHRWFAVSSILMTGSLLWFVWVDYDKPWRGFQNNYFVGKAALAHLDYLDATREEHRDEIAVAKQRLADEQKLAEQTTSAQRKSVEAELVHVALSFKQADNDWSRESQLLEVTKDSYEKALGRHGPEHVITRKVHKKLTDDEANVEQLLALKERYEEEKKSLEATLQDLDKGVRVAAKRITELEQAAADALKKDQEYRGVLTDDGLLAGLPIVTALINAPLIDFAAAKSAPARQQVHQLVLPEVRQRLNYLESYTTDRCTTCHVAIDDPEFTRENLAKRLERSIPGVNEAMQRLNFAPLPIPAPPVLANANKKLTPGKVTDHWDALTTEQQVSYFDELLSLVNTYLKKSDRKTIELGHPLLAHPDLDLFVSIDSPHAMGRMGCTVCHEGNPQETDFVQAAHTPPTHEVQERWEEEYYIRVFGVPNVDFETIQHYWDRPMLLPQYTEAGCAKCHSQISDIANFDGERYGSRINLGRHLFVTAGCVNCHAVDTLPDQRRVGPDLRQVASKLTPDFVQRWAFFPQKFRPSTRMPHLFNQENSRAESANSLDPDPVLRTETEVAAISSYLFAVSREWTPVEKPADVQGDAARGRDLFVSVGCLACHANVAEFGEEWITNDLMHRDGVDAETARYRFLGMTYEQRVAYSMEHFVDEQETFLHPDGVRFDPTDEYTTPTFSRFAPELSGIGSKVTQDWLYSWLMEPAHYSADTRMPDLRLLPAEAADLAAYLATLKNDAFEQGAYELNAARREMADTLVFDILTGQRSKRGSRAIMADEGGELTDMLVALLEGSDSLGKEGAERVVDALSTDGKKLLFLGSKMITHYGCYACHNIAGFETATPPGTDLSKWTEKPIAQLDFAFFDHAFHDMRHEKDEVYGYVYPRDADELNHWSPTDDQMREEISHTHAAFAKHKLLNPRIWDREKLKKPYDKLKMPNFYFTEEEAEALTTYLLSRIPPRVTASVSIDYDSDVLGPIARGRNLTRELNCVGCHEIEDNAPTIQQYFRKDVDGSLAFDAINAPPLLWGEGAKVQHSWLHDFLQGVVPIRPWLAVRMPSFTLTVEEATTLVEYFAALSRQDSEKLAAARAPVTEYVEGELVAAKRTGDEAVVKAAGDDWYAEESLAHSLASLRRFAVDRKLMRANTLDPLLASAKRFKGAHGDLLKRTDFMRKLYEVSFPFVEPPTPMASRDEFEKGSRFFTDMGCLECHVLGNMLPGPATNTDEFVQIYRLDSVRGEGDQAVAMINAKPYSVGAVIDSHTLIKAENFVYENGDVATQAFFEGPSKTGVPEQIMLLAASAPNLGLTFQRLRRAWVYAWMLEPQLIQPGTKMPQNFPDMVSPFGGDPNYPGSTEDHINLLVDYLFQAGNAGARADLRKVVVTEDDEEFDEDGGGDDEFDDE